MPTFDPQPGMVFREFLQLFPILLGRLQIKITQTEFDKLPRDLQRHFQPDPEPPKK